MITSCSVVDRSRVDASTAKFRLCLRTVAPALTNQTAFISTLISSVTFATSASSPCPSTELISRPTVPESPKGCLVCCQPHRTVQTQIVRWSDLHLRNTRTTSPRPRTPYQAQISTSTGVQYTPDGVYPVDEDVVFLVISVTAWSGTDSSNTYSSYATDESGLPECASSSWRSGKAKYEISVSAGGPEGVDFGIIDTESVANCAILSRLRFPITIFCQAIKLSIC